MLTATVDIVRTVAAREVMPRFLNTTESRKHDGSVVTEADIAAQRALEPMLRGLVDCAFVGEEMTRDEQDQAWADGRGTLWCVDPIDGTSNFACGLPSFAISVALMRAGRPVLGVIYDPVGDEAFQAEVGQGAWVNARRLPLRRRTVALRQAMAGIEFKRLDRALAATLTANAPYCSQRSYGSSALEWCYAAAGRFDVYLHGGQKLWDFAAGWLIFQEAGGQCASLDHDDFWTGELWEKSVIAALDPTLFIEWKAWLRAHHRSR
ncbi:MAG: inositol monophosphatase [Proteobacteria bacterium]|nr:inositol monophosphatase [Burkholderiales bacterium]